MNGRLSSITSGDTTVGFTYDAAGRIATSKQTTAQTDYPFSYSYYLDGSLHTQTYPSGRALTYGVDLMGRITSVTGQLGGQTAPYASSASYAAHGGLTSVVLGNGLVERWSYNAARQQPWRIQLGTAAVPNSVDEWLNDYCPTALFAGGSCAANNGNVMAQKVGSLGNAKTVYDYDWLNRILSATESGNGTGWSQTYGYDAHGNRWVSANAGVALSANTPTSLSNYTGTMNNRVTVNNATYDNAGNQTAIGGFSFTFDAENRVTSSTIVGNTTTYAYDGEGRRVKKGSTVFVYDAFGKLAAEYGGTPSPNQTEYLTADHLGSTRLVTKADGTRDRCYDYLPFGEEIPQGVSGRGACYPADGSTPTSAVKFTGQFRDSETGLDYFGSRYMSAAQGRFTSPDPLLSSGRPWLPQSWNRYAYSLNNPLRFVDPDGLWEWDANCKKEDTTCTENREKFRNAVQHLRNALAKTKKGSDAYKALTKALGKIGTEGDGNNLRVAFSSTQRDPGDTRPTIGGNIRMTLNFGLIDNPLSGAGYKASDPAFGISEAGLVLHEGTHASEGFRRGVMWVLSGQERANFEGRGNNAESLFYETVNNDPYRILWNPSWVGPDKDKVEQRRREAVENATQQEYGKKPKIY